MENFNRKEFNKLSSINDKHCVSIYIPTHIKNEAGEGYKMDQTKLKNQLKEVKKQMLTYEVAESEIDTYLQPIENLIDDTEFWKNQRETLAIFYNGHEVMTYRLPVTFKEFSHVNNHFYLKPVTTLLHGEDFFYILAISMGDVKLYEASKTSISPVNLPSDMPGKLEDVVGHDFEEKTLQRRSGQGESGDAEGIFHGQGSGNESEKKEELLKYLREVDQYISEFLKGEDTPLVLACVDYLHPIYRDVTDYDYVLEDFIAGNYEHENMKELHEKAVTIVIPHLEKEKADLVSKFKEMASENRSSSDENNAIPASIGGRTETLILKENETLWGIYDKETHSIEIHEIRKTGDADLLNLAAVETAKHKGHVYIMEEDKMPVGESEVNAIYRYPKG